MTKLVVDYPWLTMRNFFALGGEVSIEGLIEKNLKSINKAIVDYSNLFDGDKITSITIACDYGSYRYRDKKKFKNYKSTRKREPHPNMQTVFDHYKYAPKIFRNIGIDYITLKGVEADDIGFYYANTVSGCCLFTTDRDWQQSLVNDNHVLLSPKGNRQKYPTGYEIVKKDEAYGSLSTPLEFAIMKALVGDISDNIDKASLKEYINEETVRAFLEDRDSLPKEIVDHISYNLHLTRLDHIMSDEEAIRAIKYSEGLTRNVRLSDIHEELHKNNIYAYDSLIDNLHEIVKK